VIAYNRLNKKPADEEEDEEDDEMDVEEVDSDEWDDLDEDEEVQNPGLEAIPITTCLFCPHVSKDYEKNLLHMMEKHSFFIPDMEYVIDIEGLLGYLGEKVRSS
jgi:pre-60S factor REI1